MDAGAQLEPERAHRVTDVERAANRVVGLVEDREDTVPGGVHQRAPVPAESLADTFVVALEQLCPGAIAERDRQRRPLDDVDEEHRGRPARRRRCRAQPGLSCSRLPHLLRDRADEVPPVADWSVAVRARSTRSATRAATRSAIPLHLVVPSVAMYSRTSSADAKSQPVRSRHRMLPNSVLNHAASSWPRFITGLKALSSSARAFPPTAIVPIMRSTLVRLLSTCPSASPIAITPAVSALHVIPVKSVPPMNPVVAWRSSIGATELSARSSRTASAQWNPRSCQCA